MSERIRELNEKERSWLDARFALGQGILQWARDSKEVSADALDDAFEVWRAQASDRRPSNAELVEGLGALFGRVLIEQLGGRWVVVSDEHGTDLALVLTNGTEMYPLASVAKRIPPAPEQRAFFGSILHAVQMQTNPS